MDNDEIQPPLPKRRREDPPPETTTEDAPTPDVSASRGDTRQRPRSVLGTTTSAPDLKHRAITGPDHGPLYRESDRRKLLKYTGQYDPTIFIKQEEAKKAMEMMIQ